MRDKLIEYYKRDEYEEDEIEGEIEGIKYLISEFGKGKIGPKSMVSWIGRDGEFGDTLAGQLYGFGGNSKSFIWG